MEGDPVQDVAGIAEEERLTMPVINGMVPSVRNTNVAVASGLLASGAVWHLPAFYCARGTLIPQLSMLNQNV